MLFLLNLNSSTYSQFLQALVSSVYSILSNMVVRIYASLCIKLSQIHIPYIHKLRAWRWCIASIRHLAGGAQLRPYRPVLQGFMHHTELRCKNLCIIQNCVARIYASYRIASREFMHHTELRRENLCIIQNCVARIYASYRIASREFMHHTELRRENLCTVQNCVARIYATCQMSVVMSNTIQNGVASMPMVYHKC